MTDMLIKTTRVLARAALIAVNLLTIPTAQAQPEGVTRTDLQRHDLSAAGREAIQVRVDLAPGVAFPATPIRAKKSSTCSGAQSNIRLRANSRSR